MKVNAWLLGAQIIGMAVIFAMALFGAAGTWFWLEGWVFVILFFGFVLAVSLWLWKNDPALLHERMTAVGSPKQKAWDKRLLGLTCLVFVGWLSLMALDAVRYAWSHVPIGFQAAGLILLLASFVLFFSVFRENPYLSAAVRVQKDRGQQVISTGPYRYVRHPMYAALLPFGAGASLLVGSWFGLLGGLPLMALVAWRAILEERSLSNELAGYKEYMERVRHRLIPGVW